MNSYVSRDGGDTGTIWPPGTVAIEDLQHDTSKIILQPQPSEDPDDPLNWSKIRKGVNFALVCYYSLMTFVLLDIGTVVWGPVHTELGISYPNLNKSFATNCAGLAVGCIFIIPFAYKYGRRPVYLISSIIQIVGAVWQARIQTTWELLAVNAFCGIGGAISETIVQMTVADLFFIHQRATMNAVYLSMVNIGTFLAPVPAGFVAELQGWRWIWWWTSILLAVNLVAIIFFFEETKYVVKTAGTSAEPISLPQETDEDSGDDDDVRSTSSLLHRQEQPSNSQGKKSYRQRLALVTVTDTPLLRHLYQPFLVLATFPAVTYTAFTFGSLLAWFSVLATIQSTYLLSPPYNFTPTGVGLFSIAPFVGGSIGCILGGPLNDWWILWMAKLNKGVFEPEMRLYLALPAILTCPTGILIFGLAIAKGLPWIIAAAGSAIYGFTFAILADICLTYMTDCYQDIIGDALVAVAFVRNGFATVIVLFLATWIKDMGLYNTMICVSCLSILTNLFAVPMLLWGKKARLMTAKKYKQMALLQPAHRTFK